MVSPAVAEAARTAPAGPGVYRFNDADGRALYIGKAKNLKRRLASHMRPDAPERITRMREQAHELTVTVCASEAEALVLEAQWIRTHKPRFNVLLVEGGDYASVFITKEKVARVQVARGAQRRDAERYGPFPGARGRDLLDALTRIYPVRSCAAGTYRRAELAGRACLLAEIGRCSAPCVGKVTADEHQELVKQLQDALVDGGRKLVERIRTEMEEAAVEHRYELAARRRDDLRALSATLQLQALQFPTDADAVVVRRHTDGRQVIVTASARNGGLAAVRCFHSAEDEHELLLYQLLTGDSGLSNTIVVETRPPGTETVLAALEATGRTKPSIAVGASGWRADLLAVAVRNADSELERLRIRRPDTPEHRDQALTTLAHVTGLARPPRRIECLDISHTQGQQPVGSFSVAENGAVAESSGRVVFLPEEVGGDDYRSIKLALQRRFSGSQLGTNELPDLLVIDGGKGQVSAAREVLDSIFAGVVEGRPALVGIAKRLEELWLPGAAEPVMLPRNDGAQLLVQALRDQAHNQGVRNHRRRREQHALRNGLEAVPGVGSVTAKALLAAFGTVNAVAGASMGDLQKVPGVGPKAAERIHAYFHPDESGV